MKKFLSVATIASAVLLTACGGSKEAPKDAAATAEPQILNRFLAAEPKTLDGSKATDLYASQLLALNNEGLVAPEKQADGTDKIVPAGAESWKVEDNGMKYTFTLRKDAVWSDGQKVTAKDYLYGMTRTLDPKTASSYAFILAPIKGAEAFTAGTGKVEDLGIKVVDDYTLEITLEKPTPYFLEVLYFKSAYPQRQDIVEKHGEKYGTEANTLVSNGPFIIKEWVHNSKVIVEKSPSYWDKANVKLDQQILQIVQDENSRMNMMLNGQVDIGAASKPEWMKKFDDMKAFTYIKGPALSTVYQTYNVNDKLFSNKKIRQAFSLAFDREELNQVIYDGIHTPAYGFVPPGTMIDGKDYRKEVPEQVQELKKNNPDAKALFVEGLKELGMDPDPSKVTVTYLNGSTSAFAKKMSEYQQQMFKKNLGIEVKAEFVEWAVFQKRQDELDYQFAGQGWSADYNDPNTFLDMWISTAGIVANGWKSPAYDEIIAKASRTTDSKERLDLFKQAEQMIVVDEAIVAPMIYRNTSTYVRNYVKGFNPATMDANYNFKGVSIEGKK